MTAYAAVILGDPARFALLVAAGLGLLALVAAATNGR